GRIENSAQSEQAGIEIMGHSTGNVVAEAITRLYENVNFGGGPVIEEGFYYDMDMEHAITPEDVPKIEKEMQRIIEENLEIKREEVSREEAKRMFREI